MRISGETNQPPKPKSIGLFTTGLFALILLIVNAVATTASYFASGEGVDSLVGFGYVVTFFTVPALLFTIFLAILSVIYKKGRLPGAIALAVASAAVRRLRFRDDADAVKLRKRVEALRARDLTPSGVVFPSLRSVTSRSCAAAIWGARSSSSKPEMVSC